MRGLPALRYDNRKAERQLTAFGGVNYSTDFSDGEFSDMQNMSSRLFPYLTQRKDINDEHGLGFSDKVVQIASFNDVLVHTSYDGDGPVGTKLHFFYGVDDTVGKGWLSFGSKTKTFLLMGDRILIWPDRKYYDFVNREFGTLNFSYTGTMSFSGRNTITVNDMDDCQFRQGDLVVINLSGTKYQGVIRAIEHIDANSHSFTFDDELFPESLTSADGTISRDVPVFDCVCIHANRVWGAKDNVIYASPLGDPFNYSVFDGVSTDSYQVAVATEGPFTACIEYGTAVLFFKEKCIHKVLGGYPAEYQVYTYNYQGVAQDSGDSLVNINEILYYNGVDGIYRYVGNAPQKMSLNFGEIVGREASAWNVDDNYYIRMKIDNSRTFHQYMYDTVHNIWTEYGPNKGYSFCHLKDEDHPRGVTYFIIQTHDLGYGSVWSLDGDTGEDHMFDSTDYTEPIEWSVTFCPFGYHEVSSNSTGKMGTKHYNKLYIRADVERGADMTVEVNYDGKDKYFVRDYPQLTDKLFERVFYTKSERRKTVVIPILIKRCDFMQVRIRGNGKVVLKAFEREYNVGSEYN